MDITTLAKAIQYNCDLSDARYCGIYSLCSFILKLRNLYKWQHHLEPWNEPESAVVLQWIEEREEYWESLAGQEFQNLIIAGKQFDPFDVEGVNEQLSGSHLCYGAGYGRSMKPLFFLGELRDRKTLFGCTVSVLGKEFARDLSSPLALLQEENIYVRKEPLKFFFWDQITEIRSSRNQALRNGLALHGLESGAGMPPSHALSKNLGAVIDQEVPAFIHHEIGELREDSFDRVCLQTIVREYSGSSIEFLARAVRDILADTHPDGMMGYILKERKESSLAFYVAFLDGLRRLLFPEIGEAYTHFLADRNWDHIDKAVQLGRKRNRKRAAKFSVFCDRLKSTDPAHLLDDINRELLAPLGLTPPEAESVGVTA